MKTTHFIGIFATMACICVAKGSIFNWSPQYTAEAEYSINWNQIGLGDEDFKPQKASSQYDNQIAKFNASGEFVAQLCKKCSIPEAQSDLVAKSLRQNLSITWVGKVGADDLYRVRISDDNQKVALNAVNLLTRRLVQRINVQAKIQDAKQTYSSYQENALVREEQSKLRDELASLFEEQQQEYGPERQARINEIQDQLNGDDVRQGETGLKMFIYLVAAFSDPAQIQKRAEVVMN